MELEFDVHVDANALYDYMLRHTFTKAAGFWEVQQARSALLQA